MQQGTRLRDASLRGFIHEPTEKNSPEARQPKNQKDDISYPTPLESHDGISQNQRHTVRHEDARHKNIKNTLRYNQPVAFENEGYTYKTAANVEEATQLVEAGFEYVCATESVKLFRKRKQLLSPPWGFSQTMGIYAEKLGMGVEPT